MNKLFLKFCVIALVTAALFSCSKSGVNYNLIPASIDGEMWGYIDTRGHWQIDPQFGSAGFFSDGLACVSDDNGKVGYINTKGLYEIMPQYTVGTPFTEGLAWVALKDTPPICIDTKGNIRFVFKEADFVYTFSEGMAVFFTGEGKYGAVDKTGKIVINPVWDMMGAFFSEGLVPVVVDDKYGYINKEGKVVINPCFEGTSFFRGGLAAVEVDINGDYKWGFIDKTGKMIITPRFDEIYPMFSNGSAAVEVEGKCGFIDKAGRIVINPQFEAVMMFSEGLAPVSIDDYEKWGYIDTKGKVAINPVFNRTYNFINGAAIVRSGDKYGLIDRDGKFIAYPQFEYIGIFDPFWGILGGGIYSHLSHDDDDSYEEVATATDDDTCVVEEAPAEGDAWDDYD